MNAIQIREQLSKTALTAVLYYGLGHASATNFGADTELSDAKILENGLITPLGLKVAQLSPCWAPLTRMAR